MIIKKKKLNRGNVQEEPQAEQLVAENTLASDNLPEFNYSDTVQTDTESLTQNQAQQEFTLPETSSGSAPQMVQNVNINPVTTPEPDDIDLFSLDNIDFKQREERRKGDRRRGFRRVDDRNLISRAREEADALRESAMKEGYQAGLEQAQAELQGIKETFEAFMNAPQEVYEMLAPNILEISVDIAQKIIKKETEQDPQVLINTVIDVLKGLAKDENKISLRVNPVQADAVKQQVPEILNLAGLDAKISVLADEEVTEGGCLVTTSNGIVDATIETQLSVISEALRQV